MFRPCFVEVSFIGFSFFVPIIDWNTYGDANIYRVPKGRTVMCALTAHTVTTNLDSVNGYPKLEWNMPAKAKTECIPFTSYRMCHVKLYSSNRFKRIFLNQYACQRNDHTGNWQIDVESKLCRCTECTRKIWVKINSGKRKSENEAENHSNFKALMPFMLKLRKLRWWEEEKERAREGILHTWWVCSRMQDCAGSTPTSIRSNFPNMRIWSSTQFNYMNTDRNRIFFPLAFRSSLHCHLAIMNELQIVACLAILCMARLHDMTSDHFVLSKISEKKIL